MNASGQIGASNPTSSANQRTVSAPAGESPTVLFVDDDQARVLHGREQRRTGADDNVGLAVAGGEPGVEPITVVDR